MNIKYEGEIVEIKSKDEWTYKTIDSRILCDVNPTLFNKIQIQVENYTHNKEELDRIEKEKTEVERIKKQTILVEEFKNEVEQYSELLKDYNIEFENPKAEIYLFKPKKLNIRFKETYKQVIIEYSEFVSKGQWGRKERTNSKWVMNFDYKDRRYSTLEKAIKAGIKKLEEYKTEKERKEYVENQQNIAKDAMKKFAESNGYEFCEEYHSRRNYRGFSTVNGWYTYYMKKDYVTADLVYNKEKDIVVITGYKVRKEGITLKDLEKVL